MAAWSNNWNTSNTSWSNSDWRGDQYKSTVEPEEIDEICTKLDDLRRWLVHMQDECEDSKRRFEVLWGENKNLAARVYELEQDKKRKQQQRIMSPVRTSGSRRDRPRSGSLPPPATCFWHEAGNAGKVALPDYGMTSLTVANEAYDWWNHFNSVVLSAHVPFSEEFWKWLQHQFARKRITVLFYYSSRVRHSVIKCNKCGEMFIMFYS
jgi:hypothetical protein